MKKSGRSVTPLTKKQKKACQEYLNSDKSYVEVAEKYGVVKTTLIYWVKKYRKELDEIGQENQ